MFPVDVASTHFWSRRTTHEVYTCAVAGGRLFVSSFVLVAATAGVSHAGFTVFEGAGANVAAITPTRDAFRTAVGGGTVAGANGSFGGAPPRDQLGRRPRRASPTRTRCPPTSSTSTRPAAWCSARRAPASSSAPTPAGPRRPLFGFPNDFQAFSPQKLFTAVNSTDHRRQLLRARHDHRRPRPARSASIFVDVEVAGSPGSSSSTQNNTLIFTRERPGRAATRG